MVLRMANARHPVKRAVKYVFITLLTIFLVAAGVFGVTAFQVWHFARSDDRRPADTIFVLGAAQYAGNPTNWFASRLNHAAELYEQGVAPTIVTVGGKVEGDLYTEAAAGKNYLVENFDIPESAVVPVEEGADTLKSAEAFAQVADDNGWRTSVVVTDPAHSLRATRMVRDQGLDAWASPTRQGPSVFTRKSQANSILHETLGMLYYEVVEKRK